MPLGPKRLCVIFFTISSSLEIQNHTSPVWHVRPGPSQNPETLAPYPYSARLSKQLLPVQAAGQSPPRNPSVSHPPSPAQTPPTTPQHPPPPFPSLQNDAFAEYFLRAP